MKIRTLTKRSVRYHWRSSLQVWIGTLIAATILVGALLVGDSVRYSLRRLALLRLGGIEFAMQVRGRFFSAELARLVQERAGVQVAPVLQVRGVAFTEVEQVNRCQVLGVDQAFWSFADGDGPRLGGDGVAIGRKLADRLSLEVGDELSLRVKVPGVMSRDAPLAAGKERLSSRSRLTVAAIVEDEGLGRFSMKAEQIAPYNLFVSLDWLQAEVNADGRANLLVAGQAGHGQVTVADLQIALADVWRLEHVGMRLRELPDKGMVQLESDGIFLAPSVAETALRIRGAVGTLTYLVNSIAKVSDTEPSSTPYSFVTACSPSDNRTLSPVPFHMSEDGIVINRWLAQHLDAWPGDDVTVSYSELLSSNDYTENRRNFRVRGIAGMDAIQGERELMPEFPGLSDVESCSDWDVGMPMDETLLSDEQNEAYWEQYRQTPKAFVTLSTGQEMWGSRFGNLMSVRYDVKDHSVDDLRSILTMGISPAGVGLFFLPVREMAVDAVDNAMDFGGLFIGMSFFLIVAALLLTGLLFVFGLQVRSAEIGTLLALGYPVARVRAMFLYEGAVISLAGSIGGALIASFYTRGLIWALATYWRGAVAGAAIVYDGRPVTMMIGIAASFICSVTALAIGMWRLCRRPIHDLLNADFSQDDWNRKAPAGNAKKNWLPMGITVAGVVGAILTVGLGGKGDAGHAVMDFFTAGCLLLIAGIAGSSILISVLAGNRTAVLTTGRLARRNVARRMGRSLTVVALLASGFFMVVAVASMQEDVGAHAEKRSSGTGGFALFGETTLAVQQNLGKPGGREAFGLDRDAALSDVAVVSMKVYEGDDASCFNLNRAQTPSLLGVDPEEFRRRVAFTEGDGAALWKLLKQNPKDGSVPALVGDADTAAWGLAGKVGPDGDVLVFRDEHGELFNVRLVGKLPMRISVFQGKLLISDAAFTQRFPSTEGYQAFLFDRPPTAVNADGDDALAQLVRERFKRVGMDVTPTGERLREFYSVESTYLRMFLVLGGLGLLLGSVGMGIVVMRNVIERRRELAILRSVGYGRASIRRIIVSEHLLLLVLGLLVGLVAAGIAMWPSFRTVGVDVPLVGMFLIFCGVIVFGVGCILLAAYAGTRGDLITALRSE